MMVLVIWVELKSGILMERGDWRGDEGLFISGNGSSILYLWSPTLHPILDY